MSTYGAGLKLGESLEADLLLVQTKLPEGTEDEVVLALASETERIFNQ